MVYRRIRGRHADDYTGTPILRDASLIIQYVRRLIIVNDETALPGNPSSYYGRWKQGILPRFLRNESINNCSALCGPTCPRKANVGIRGQHLVLVHLGACAPLNIFVLRPELPVNYHNSDQK